MTIAIIEALGGVGLFLVGMAILTSGLRALAGDRMRHALANYTSTPLSGVATGAVTTAVIQSSSATTVAAVGFVGAGLLTFTQALGIIFGANIGTTITGWLVALVGFKLDLGLFVMPLVLVGVLLHMFGRGSLKQAGWALCGFSLLFIGIDLMQVAMSGYEGALTPDNFPPDTLWGRLQLVAIGMVITIVTQSSSAGVATAMVALSSGVISFPQAAAMVIGMDVGTTFTAVLATVGGSGAMRQTGLAHVIYNLFTGTMAFLLVGGYTALMDGWVAGGAAGNAQIAVVGFHTFFNALGVLFVLPVARQFAAFIQRVVPEHGTELEWSLDDAMLEDPAAASMAVLGILRRLYGEVCILLLRQLSPDPRERRRRQQHDRMEKISRTLKAVQDYVDRIPGAGNSISTARQTVAYHLIDHLGRLVGRCRQDGRIDGLAKDERLSRLKGALMRTIDTYAAKGHVAKFDTLRQLMRRQRTLHRRAIVALHAERGIPDPTLLNRLDAGRWLQRVSYHLWRIEQHLEAGGRY